MKLFVMSDTHSYYNEMQAALTKNGFDKDNPDHHLVVCGDLFDRGPDSVKVFNFVKELAEQDRFSYVYGNHEGLLFDCYNDFLRYGQIYSHHVSNGTLDTISQFTGINKYDLYCGIFDHDDLRIKMKPVFDFINNYAVDYAEAGDYIFVHGWIPCDKYFNVANNWDTSDADWQGACWINGIEAWMMGAKIPGKTIVCGHWHTSWGWARRDPEKYEEFPRKKSDKEACFMPFVDEGIMAIDACTAYTGFCNCVVLDV